MVRVTSLSLLFSLNMLPMLEWNYRMLWASFAFPIVNGIRFYLFLKRHKMPKTEHFMEDDAFPKAEKFKVTEDKVNDHFISIQKLADMNDGKLEGMGYKRSEERGKFKVIEFARGPAEGVVSDER